MNSQRLILLFVSLLLTSASAFSQQDTSSIYHIKLNSGTEMFGTVVEMHDSIVVLNAREIGQVTLLRKNIRVIEKISAKNFKDGEYWFKNPNATRYLLGPSAIPLKAGEGYYQNTYLLLHSCNVGLTDYLSFGGGFEILSTFVAGEPIFYLAPKAAFKVTDKFHLGTGILYASVPNGSNSNREEVGIAFGIGTYGNTDNNFTLGIGYGFSDGDFAKRPFITFSGMARASKKVAFVSENWLVPSTKTEEKYDPSIGYYTTSTTSYPAYISYGLRFFGEKLSVDLAFINSAEIADDIPIGVPFIDFVVKF